MTPEQHAAQRKSWVTGELMIQYPDMTRDDAETIYETANTGNIMEEIKAAAIALLNGPRAWGRGINSTLSDLVGIAISQASKTTLPTDQFEALRSAILKQLRTPT